MSWIGTHQHALARRAESQNIGIDVFGLPELGDEFLAPRRQVDALQPDRIAASELQRIAENDAQARIVVGQHAAGGARRLWLLSSRLLLSAWLWLSTRLRGSRGGLTRGRRWLRRLGRILPRRYFLKRRTE